MGGTAALKTPIWVIPYQHQSGSQMASTDMEILEYSIFSAVSNSKFETKARAKNKGSRMGIPLPVCHPI